MAKTGQTRGGNTRFKKGQSGNPAGSSARAREMGAIARMTNEEIADVGSAILFGSEDNLDAIINDPEANIMRKWTAKMVRTSMVDGDPAIWNAVLNRIVGKVKERIEHTGADGDAISIRARMTVEEIEARVEALRQSRLEVGED